MKLILCRDCGDIFKLDFAERSCKCGQSSGRYLEDGVNAEYAGKPAVAIGIDNGSLSRAIQESQIQYGHIEPECFLIPPDAPTIRRIDK